MGLARDRDVCGCCPESGGGGEGAGEEERELDGRRAGERHRGGRKKQPGEVWGAGREERGETGVRQGLERTKRRERDRENGKVRRRRKWSWREREEQLGSPLGRVAGKSALERQVERDRGVGREQKPDL